MKILNQPQSINNKPLPSFTSKHGIFKKTTDIALNENSTSFFRNDLQWKQFADNLITKYKNADKVEIHCYACSDGSEPYSLAMLLIEKLGFKEAKKFFPIIAKDKDENMIELCKSRDIYLSNREVSKLKHEFCIDYSKYFNMSSDFKLFSPIKGLSYLGKTKPILNEAVNFKKADIVEDISNIEFNNTVLINRNFWPYLNKKEQKKLIKNISKKASENSIIVVGELELAASKAWKNPKKYFDIGDVDKCYIKRKNNQNDFLPNFNFLKEFLLKK